MMKTARIITGVVMAYGLILIVGAVGTSDYMDALHRFYPVTEMLKNMGIGCLLVIPYWVIRVIDDKRKTGSAERKNGKNGSRKKL